jgi:hypothetical protein
MANDAGPKETIITIDAKVIVLVLIVIGGLVSAVMLNQWLATNANRTQDESLSLSNQHFWGTSAKAEAAIAVVNSGAPDATIKKLVVGGKQCSWSDIYYWQAESGPVSNELQVTSAELQGASFYIVVDGNERNFTEATGPLRLESHWTMVLYVRNAGNASSTSVPSRVVISIFTENKLYYAEANVEVWFTFMATEQIQITNMGFGAGSGTGWIAVTINNTGTSPVTINEAWVNGVKKTTTTPSLPSGGTISGNAGLVLNITSLTVVRGNNYQVKLTSSKGNQFLYSAYAPGA